LQEVAAFASLAAPPPLFGVKNEAFFGDFVFLAQFSPIFNEKTGAQKREGGDLK